MDSHIGLDHVEGNRLVYKIELADSMVPLKDVAVPGGVVHGREVYYSGRALTRELDLTKVVRIETYGPREAYGSSVVKLRGTPRRVGGPETLLMTIGFMSQDAKDKDTNAYVIRQAKQLAAAFHVLCPNAVLE